MAALGEFTLIDRFFRRAASNAVLGVGDDAALVAPGAGMELALSVDMLVEGTHFFASVAPDALGHKTLAVNLSDMAAMGATPRWALLAGALPHADEVWLEAFARGFFALADRHGVSLVGGDTTRGPLNLCVTIVGEVPAGAALRRAGARAGDDVWVSGELGSAALALAHALGHLRLTSPELAACERALLTPTPRVELGIALRGLATSAIDISDGLLGDLAHIADASSLAATIELDAIPRAALLDARLATPERELALRALLAGGDDYELCFTAPAARASEVLARGASAGVRVARIGSMAERAANEHAPVVVRDARGVRLERLPRAFDHFAT